MKKMIKISQTTLENLLSLLPNLNIFRLELPSRKNPVDEEAAKLLFSIWKSNKKVSDHTYKRPITISASEIEKITKAGLARLLGDNIEITEKGNNIIKVMILGDDRSIYDDNGIIVPHDKALAYTKQVNIKSSAKLAQKFEDIWWRRFE